MAPIALVRHPGVDEISGIARSNHYPGIFWVHNDSGDSARLFPIKLDGSVVMPRHEQDFWVNKEVPGKKPWAGVRVVNAQNVDWEDLTIFDRTIYVSDMGNNGNARRDLCIYVIPEPNPLSLGEVRATKYPVRYPDQEAFPPKDWRFDCEAIFVYNKALYVLTKHRANRTAFLPSDATNLYRLDTNYVDRQNVLTKLDSKTGLGGWVTAAEMSPDGKTLAVLANAPKASVWFFDVSKAKNGKLLSTPSKRVELQGVKQCEAVCYESNDSVILANEQREIFRVAVP